MAYLDLTGQRFGRLVALKRVPTPSGKDTRWICRCDCGQIYETNQADMRRGKTRSCGCYKAEIDRAKLAKNGLFFDKRVPEAFSTWQCMKRRCFDNRSRYYCRYGGRGITICAEWLEFENFHTWAVKTGYAPGLELDRIDNNGNYEPSNCRWVTRAGNMRNTSRTVLITVSGQTKCLTDWCTVIGVSMNTLRRRLNISEEAAISFIASKLA